MPAAKSPTTPQPPTHTQERVALFGLSVPQILAGAAAAVTSAFAASRIGVGGTLIGAAVGSIISTIAAAAYGHSLSTATHHLRRVRTELHPVADGSGDSPTDLAVDVHAGSILTLGRGTDATTTLVDVEAPRSGGFGWKAGIALGVAAFVTAIGVITVLELGLGRPVSGDSGDSSGTSVSRLFTGTTTDSTPTPSTTPSVTDSATTPATDGPSPTATPSSTDGTTDPTATPTSDPTDSATDGPTQAPSSDPTIPAP